MIDSKRKFTRQAPGGRSILGSHLNYITNVYAPSNLATKLATDSPLLSYHHQTPPTNIINLNQVKKPPISSTQWNYPSN